MAATNNTPSTPERTEGYVRSHDGIGIYYTVEGSGPPIVLSSGISVSFLYWKYLAPVLTKRYRVIQWNYRGHGKSDSVTDSRAATISNVVEDLERIRSHLNISRCAHLGHSMGVQVILEYYRRYPHRVSALIPALGTFEKPFDSFFDFRPWSVFFACLYWMARFKHPAMKISWNLIHLNPFRMNFHLVRALRVIHRDKCSWDDFHPYFAHYKRLDMNTFFELARSAQNHSAADVLPHVAVPTMVIGGTEDRFTPVELSRFMAQSIPGCEYLELPEGSHAAFLEDPDVINEHIVSFLDRNRRGRGWQKRPL